MSARSKKPPKARPIISRDALIAKAWSALASTGEFTSDEMDYVAAALVDDLPPPQLTPLSSLGELMPAGRPSRVPRGLRARPPRSTP